MKREKMQSPKELLDTFGWRLENRYEEDPFLAIPFLAERLRDPDHAVRHKAAWAITEMGPQFSEFIREGEALGNEEWLHSFLTKTVQGLSAKSVGRPSEISSWEILAQASSIVKGFERMESRAARILLLRHFFSGKRLYGPFSHLKRETLRIKAKLFEFVGNPAESRDIGDAQIISFIEKNVESFSPEAGPPFLPPPEKKAIEKTRQEIPAAEGTGPLEGTGPSGGPPFSKKGITLELQARYTSATGWVFWNTKLEAVVHRTYPLPGGREAFLVKFRGTLDELSLEYVKDYVHRLYDQNVQYLLLDLSEVEIKDVEKFLSVLCYFLVKPVEGKIHLIGFPKDLLEKLSTFPMETFPSPEEAIESIADSLEKKTKPAIHAPPEHYSFEQTLKELMMEEGELGRLVSEGEIRAFRDEGKIIFKKSDIDGLKKGKLTEPEIVLPSGEEKLEEGAEDAEVLLVEEDACETLLDIDDLEMEEARADAAATVDFSSCIPTEELTFEEERDEVLPEPSKIPMTEDIPKKSPETSYLVSGKRADKPEKAAEEKKISPLAKKATRPPAQKEWFRKGIHALRKSKAKWEEKARAAGVPLFEIWLSEDAGRPGPVERFTAQSLLIMKGFQATIGLRFILLANFIDNFLELFTGYLQNIFRTWKMLKAVQRRIRREISGTQVEGVAKDLAISRVLLSRFLGLSGFYLEECLLQRPSSPEWQKIVSPSFPLRLALEIRGKLDDMKQDLDLVTSGQVFQLARRTVGDALLSFVPNPVDWISPWKDLFILVFLMKYSRNEIEKMYANLLLAHQRVVDLLQEKYEMEKGAPIAAGGTEKFMPHENSLLKRLGKEPCIDSSLENSIAQSKSNLQRFLYALCNPGRLVDPQKWSRFDLIQEVKEMERMDRIHPLYSLEMEQWLTSEVSRVLRKKREKIDPQERMLRYQEAKEFRMRYRGYRPWSERCEL